MIVKISISPLQVLKKFSQAVVITAFCWGIGGIALGSTLREADGVITSFAPGAFLNDVVTQSVRIARVRVVNRTAVDTLWFIEKNGKPISPCGHMYEVEVVESLKGDSTSFSFFSAVEKDFQGFDRDYLVFVLRRDSGQVLRNIRALENMLKDSEHLTLLCRSEGEYYVPVQLQFMRAFDPDASREFGSDWVAPPNRPSVLWCEQDAGKKAATFVTRRKISEDMSSTLVEWSGLKKIIKEAMGEKYKFWVRHGLPEC